MAHKAAAADLVSEVADLLPFLRRYARAITGSQDTGDRFALATLEALIAEPRLLTELPSPRVALYRCFHAVWRSAGAPLGDPDSPLSRSAQAHMEQLTANSREALLLFAIEEFQPDEIGQIMGLDEAEVVGLIDAAKREMLLSIAGSVLVIEDEAIIAMDLARIVRELGHRVTGIARTRKQAVDVAAAGRPDLILADIQLADNSSGIDAVTEITRQFGTIPVIYITAFPRRLLTGTRPEPTFLIAKPFSEQQVMSAVSQAMFFASTSTLSEGESTGI